MKFLHLPRLIIPPNLDEILTHQQPRPLPICEECRHVKCSCGASPCLHCAEPCAYTTDEEKERFL